MPEFGALLATRWRMLHAAFLYWLMAVGYDPEIAGLSNRLYAIYLVLVLGGLGALTWFEVLGAAGQAATALAAVPGPRPLPDVLLGALGGLVGLIQIAGVGLAWWRSPLRLTWPEIAYVAGAPVPAAAIVAVAFLRVALLALPLAALLGSLAAVVLTGSDRTALAAAAVALAAALAVMGANWLAGMVRLAVPGLRVRRWLAPLVALLLAAAVAVLPAAGLWPGRTLAGSIAGAPLWPALAWLGAAALGLVAAAIWVGSRISLTDVVDESAVYARLAVYAPGDRRDPAVLARARAEARQGGRRPWLRLPDKQGDAMLAARAGLARLRRPAQLLYLVQDLSLSLSACWMLADPRIAHPWFAWLLLMVVIPPRGLGDGFAADVDAPFLRQLLPRSDLAVLVADEVLPFILLTAVALAIWLAAQPPAGSVVLGALLIPTLLALRAGCRAFAARTRLGARVQIPFAPVAAVCFGLVLLLGIVAGAPWAALVLALLLITGLGAVMANA